MHIVLYTYRYYCYYYIHTVITIYILLYSACYCIILLYIYCIFCYYCLLYTACYCIILLVTASYCLLLHHTAYTVSYCLLLSLTAIHLQLVPGLWHQILFIAVIPALCSVYCSPLFTTVIYCV